MRVRKVEAGEYVSHDGRFAFVRNYHRHGDTWTVTDTTGAEVFRGHKGRMSHRAVCDTLAEAKQRADDAVEREHRNVP